MSWGNAAAPKKRENNQKLITGLWPIENRLEAYIAEGFKADNLIAIEQGASLIMFDESENENTDAALRLCVTPTGNANGNDVLTVCGFQQKTSKAGTTYWSAWMPQGFEEKGLMWVAPGANFALFTHDQKEADDPVVRLLVSPPSGDMNGAWRTSNNPMNRRAGRAAEAAAERPVAAPAEPAKPKIGWAPKKVNPPPTEVATNEDGDDDGIPF